MTTATHAPRTSISAADLAERVAGGERFTLLDVRAQTDWSIDAPGCRSLCVPAADLLEAGGTSCVTR